MCRFTGHSGSVQERLPILIPEVTGRDGIEVSDEVNECKEGPE
jgi:hypothetical protein